MGLYALALKLQGDKPYRLPNTWSCKAVDQHFLLLKLGDPNHSHVI